MSQSKLFDQSGDIVHCYRCGAACRTAPTNTPEARLLRHKTTPGDGLCVNCAVAETFVAMEIRRMVPDPKALLLPHVQQQFARIMATGRADATPAEIDWKHVVEHWHLPFKGDKKRKRGPITAAEQDEEARADEARTRKVLGGPDPPPRRDFRLIKGGNDGGVLN